MLFSFNIECKNNRKMMLLRYQVMFTDLMFSLQKLKIVTVL